MAHHFRLPRRGEEMAHIKFLLCVCIAKRPPRGGLFLAHHFRLPRRGEEMAHGLRRQEEVLSEAPRLSFRAVTDVTGVGIRVPSHRTKGERIAAPVCGLVRNDIFDGAPVHPNLLFAEMPAKQQKADPFHGGVSTPHRLEIKKAPARVLFCT